MARPRRRPLCEPDEPTEFDTAEKNPVNFAILTTKVNNAVSHVHDRMPVILPFGREKGWLPPTTTGALLLTALPRRTPHLLSRHTQNEPRHLQRPGSHLPPRSVDRRVIEAKVGKNFSSLGNPTSASASRNSGEKSVESQFDADYWHEIAEEARTVAQAMADLTAKRHMHFIAQAYERLADHGERIARRNREVRVSKI